jgi:N-acetylmuramoyl-L-alanine amidase
MFPASDAVGLWGFGSMIDPRRIAAIGGAAMFCALAGMPPAPGEAAGTAPGKPEQSSCDRAAFRLALDVGHAAKIYGAISARGAHEYDFNLRLAREIEQKLVDAGFAKTTLMINEDGSRRGLFTRVARAQRMSADLFLSIHHDSVPDRFLETWQYEGVKRGYSDRFKGHSLFVSYGNGDVKGSLLFGKLLGNALKTRGLQYTPHYTEKFMGSRRRELVDPEAGVYRYDQLVVLKDTRMPAVLLEAGSIINRDEEQVMASPERRALITAGVVEAVDKFCAARSQQPAVAARPAAVGRPAAMARPASTSHR